MMALKRAALELLVAEGTSFSIRDVARHADVNHGLVHRHFGSKRDLIVAALADRSAGLQRQLSDGSSPVDLGAVDGPHTALLLARLILDDDTALIPGHAPTTAIVTRTHPHVDPDDPLTAGHRAALANALALGWIVFGDYLMGAAEVSPTPEAAAVVRDIVDRLVAGQAV